MGKASRAKQQRQTKRGRHGARAVSVFQSMKPGEVWVRTFFPGAEAQTTSTTPIKMVEQALRHDDRVDLLCAKVACDMVGQSMLDFVFPGVEGFFSDGEGSIYDAAFYYGAADCLEFACKAGFEIDDKALLVIAQRVYWSIDDMSPQDVNYLPVSIVVEAYLREMVRRLGIEASKAHVATPSDDGLVCHWAMMMLGVIEEEIAGAPPPQRDSTSTPASFADHN